MQLQSCEPAINQDLPQGYLLGNFYGRVVDFGPGTCCFIKIAFNNAYLDIFRVGDVLSNSDHLLFEDFSTEFVYDGKMSWVNNRLTF